MSLHRSIFTLAVFGATLAASSVTAQERPQLLVLDLQHSPEIDAATVRTLTDLITIETGREKAVASVSGAELRNLVKLEGEKALMGCDEDSCLAEIAGALGARFVLSGRVSSIGAIKVLQMSIFDATTATAISREAAKAEDIAGFVDAIGPAVKTLLGPVRALLLEEEKAAKEAAAKAAAAKAKDDDGVETSTAAVSNVEPAQASPAIADDADPYATPAIETDASAEEAGGGGLAIFSGVSLMGIGGIVVVASGLGILFGVPTFATKAPGDPVLFRYLGGGAAVLGGVGVASALGLGIGGVALVIRGLSE